jgi:hypothetical protein
MKIVAEKLQNNYPLLGNKNITTNIISYLLSFSKLTSALVKPSSKRLGRST